MAIRIAHVITTFYDTNVTGFVLALAAEQQRQGWEVELIVGRNASPELMKQKRAEGMTVLQVPSLRKYVRPLHEVQALLDLYRLFRRGRYQVVHTHLSKAGVIGRLAAGLAGVPRLVHSVYGANFGPGQFWGRRFLFRNLERLAGRTTDAFIFVGRELMEAYRRGGVCPPARGQVIYVGKNLQPFLEVAALTREERQRRRRDLGFDDHYLILGNVSRIVPAKGHHYAVEAVARLKKRYPALKLVIVGDAKTPSEQDYKERLVRLVRQRGLEQDIIFTGWVKEPARYYGAFDLYVQTSLAPEGLPETIIEAAAVGLPVLGFHCYGLREIPGVQATLVPPRDLPDLSRALEEEIHRLIGSPPPGSGPAAHWELLCRQFDQGRMLQETWELYQKLLRN